ncbi:hypothetical protein [Falsigemmobacter faecalis]|uniref:hypothetical protein n=1 Tax=Falsigemmobacter faecalis TaxID=2488730 RepID=UPI00131556BA|nr:hypothetical protein [Falsigemmobacter faecalis]
MKGVRHRQSSLAGAFTAILTFGLTFWSSESLVSALAVYMPSRIGGSALIPAPVTIRL